MRTRTAFPLLAALIASFTPIGMSWAQSVEFPATNPAQIVIPEFQSILINAYLTKGGAGGHLAENFQLILPNSAEGESTNSVPLNFLNAKYINGPARITAKPVVSAVGSGIPYQLQSDTNWVSFDSDGDGAMDQSIYLSFASATADAYFQWLNAGNTPLPVGAYSAPDIADSGVLVNISRFTNQPYGMILLPAEGTSKSINVPAGKIFSLVSPFGGFGPWGFVLKIRGYTNNWTIFQADGPETVTFEKSPSISADIVNYYLANSGQIPQSTAFLAQSIADQILVASNNYGIATKADLGIVASNTLSQVQSHPNSYNLFTLSQKEASYDEGITAGTSLVTSSPSSFNLYTADSIMDMHMGGLMIQRQGGNATVVFQPQTTTNLKTQPFTNNGTPITNTIPMPGSQGFIRINAQPIATPSPL